MLDIYTPIDKTSVALIQNQSEMSHYGYADARPIFNELGYNVTLYTAQNIDELSADLKRVRFHATVFASNALNDKTIRDIVMSENFSARFAEFLKTGRGCLVLHQLRLAQESLPLKFLCQPHSLVTPSVRDPKEKASDGTLRTSEITNNHVCFLYPNKTNTAEIKSQCLSFRSLKGLYWHYWDNVSGTEWDLLLHDTSKDGNERPLILVSKESEAFRIVLCSLTLDWQKQKRLLENILTYVIEGKHYTAIIKDSKNVSAAFEYFIECLKSQEYPFRIYDVGQDLRNLVENVKGGVHTTIILDPFISEARLGPDIDKLIDQQVIAGRAKLIGIDQASEPKKFYVSGRERYAVRLLHDIEFKVQKELYRGYIDGSFWSTIESLQALGEMRYIQAKYDKQTLAEVFKSADAHDRDGSYDEVFGVTCALLWFRATYLGVNDGNTQRTLGWIRKNLSEFEDREKTLAYYTMQKINVATSSEAEAMKAILSSQQFGDLSEVDSVAYLKAAIIVKDKDVLTSIVNRLESLQQSGRWIDLATSATAVTALLDVLSLLRTSDTALYSKIRPHIESMLFKAIIYIQNSREYATGSKPIDYPWDNKASTSLRCVQAWLKFEELIDMPIHEMIDTLKNYKSVDVSESSTRTALTILEELKSENRRLLEDKNRLSSEAAKGKTSLRWNRFLWATVGLTLYFIVTVFITSIVSGTDTPIRTVLKKAFAEHWEVHSGIAALVVVTLTLLATLGVIKIRRKS